MIRISNSTTAPAIVETLKQFCNNQAIKYLNICVIIKHISNPKLLNTELLERKCGGMCSNDHYHKTK